MGFVKSDISYILSAVKAAERHARMEPPALAHASAELRGDTVFNEHLPASATDENPSAPSDDLSDEWMRLYAELFEFRLEARDKSAIGARYIPLAASEHDASPQDYAILQIANAAAPLGAGNAPPAYSTHPSAIAFLRAYSIDEGRLSHDGALLQDAAGTAPATEQIIDQSETVLGLTLSTADMANAPLLATDAFGSLALSEGGRPFLVSSHGLIELDPSAPISSENGLRSGQCINDAITSIPFAEHNAALADILSCLEEFGVEDFLKELIATPAGDGESGTIASATWNGDKLFLAARFGAEMRLKNSEFVASLENTRSDRPQLTEPDAPEPGAPNDETQDQFDLAFLAELAAQAAMEENGPDAFNHYPQALGDAVEAAAAAEAEVILIAASEMDHVAADDAPPQEETVEIDEASTPPLDYDL